jgi:hypothetical protein
MICQKYQKKIKKNALNSKPLTRRLIHLSLALSHTLSCFLHLSPSRIGGEQVDRMTETERNGTELCVVPK